MLGGGVGVGVGLGRATGRFREGVWGADRSAVSRGEITIPGLATDLDAPPIIDQATLPVRRSASLAAEVLRLVP